MKLVVSEMKKPIYFMLFLLLLLPLFAAPQHAYAQTGTVVRVEPETLSIDHGESHLINIWVENVDKLRAFSVEVTFDPQLLSASSLNNGGFLDPFLFEPTNSINNVDGIIRFGVAQGSIEPKSGTGILFSFEITAKEVPGETLLDITKAELVGDDYSFILCEIEHGTVTIGDVPDEQFYSFLPLIVY